MIKAIRHNQSGVVAGAGFCGYLFKGVAEGVLKYLGGLLAILAAAPTFAGDRVSEDWQFTVSPYLWALSLDGDATVRGVESDVDISFDKILEDLHIAAMLEGEVRKGRWGLFANVLYAELEDEARGKLRNTPIKIDIDVDIDVAIASFGGFYRFGPWALGSGAADTEPRLILDLYAGARYTDLDVDLDLDVDFEAIGRDRDRKAEGDENWLDPIVGLRTFWDLSPRWTVIAFGDIGGFGVGSDFQWQATGLVGYNFKVADTYDSTIYAGYRGLYQDYEDGSGDDKFEWDVTWHGPSLGWAITF